MSRLEAAVVAGGAAAFALHAAYTLYQDAKKKDPFNVEIPIVGEARIKNPTIEMVANKMGLEDVKELAGKRVLMRVDYNVPISKGQVEDPIRITSTLPTLKYLLANNVKCVVLLAHMKEPPLDFKREDFTLAPCINVLRKELGSDVPLFFLDDCVGEEVEQQVNECKQGSVFLCENVRFHVAETGEMKTKDGSRSEKADEKQIQAFADRMARLGDIYVCEAFGAAHRGHASLAKIRLPIRVAGLLMKKELDYFSQVLSAPKRPVLGIMGGAKIKDKIGVIMNLLDTVDALFIGGGMAYTFKKEWQGMKIGKSLYDEKGAGDLPKILAKAKAKGVPLFFPIDNVIGAEYKADTQVGQADDTTGIPDGWMGLDIGPKSRVILSKAIEQANTVIWNGPVGAFELAPFQGGTLSCMFDLVQAKKRGCTVILGGGDTGNAAAMFKIGGKPAADQVTWVSTGGGATLVLIEGKKMPAVEALSDKGTGVIPVCASCSSSSGSTSSVSSSSTSSVSSGTASAVKETKS